MCVKVQAVCDVGQLFVHEIRLFQFQSVIIIFYVKRKIPITESVVDLPSFNNSRSHIKPTCCQSLSLKSECVNEWMDVHVHANLQKGMCSSHNLLHFSQALTVISEKETKQKSIPLPTSYRDWISRRIPGQVAMALMSVLSPTLVRSTTKTGTAVHVVLDLPDSQRRKNHCRPRFLRVADDYCGF